MRPSIAQAIAAFFAVLALSAVSTAQARSSPLAADDWGLCAGETARAEARHAVPERLLTAISLVESGRWNKARRENLAWPWAVTSGDEGKFFPSKRAAIRHVEALRARGVRNIDVGCMQINLMHHAEAFDSLEEAFDPAANVAYAADFLKRLHARFGSWKQAATAYHSTTPHLAARYRAKLARVLEAVTDAPGRLASMDTDRQRAATERREARREAQAYRQSVLRQYLERRGRTMP